MTLVPGTQQRSRTILGEFFPLVGVHSKLTCETHSHYIENTSKTEDLVWIEVYKSDRVADIPLAQWLALTPADLVAQTLKIPIEIAEKIKKEKQVLLS